MVILLTLHTAFSRTEKCRCNIHSNPSGRDHESLRQHPSIIHQELVTLTCHHKPDPPVTKTYSTDKDKWINLERERWAHQFKIPVAASAPDGFPVSTLNVKQPPSIPQHTYCFLHDDNTLTTRYNAH